MKETECVGYMAKNWILVERKTGGKSIPACDSNLFFNFEASILQILKFPKNLYVSRFLFSTQLFSSYPPTLCVVGEIFLATLRTAITSRDSSVEIMAALWSV